MHKLILASASPRREEILKKLNLKFTVVPSKIDESKFVNLAPEKMVRELALAKARDVSQLVEDTIIIAADTVILNKREVLGKPESNEDAAEMLKKLSNGKHTVLTGVAVCSLFDGQEVTEVDKTDVFMSDMSGEDIKKYIETGEPMGKSGSYAVQGLGSIFVERIEGSYFTVMGLPIHKLAKILADFSIGIL